MNRLSLTCEVMADELNNLFAHLFFINPIFLINDV